MAVRIQKQEHKKCRPQGPEFQITKKKMRSKKMLEIGQEMWGGGGMNLTLGFPHGILPSHGQLESRALLS